MRPDHGAHGGVRALRVTVEADGGSRGNPGPAGYGAVVREAGTGRVLAERAASVGRATNNVAEYGGLIAGLRAAAEVGADEVDVRMDSKLVVEQMSGRWKVKHPSMQPLAREAAELVRGFSRVTFSWIPRAQNAHADRLANEAMDAAAQGRTWQPDPADEWLAQHEAPEPEPAASLDTTNRLSGWQDDPGPPTTTLLLRHGETALSVEKRFSGIGDPPLTEAGRAMAAAAATRLATSGATAVVSSPLRRARETAALVAEALGVDVEVEEGLRETDFGDWDGYTFAEVRQKWPAELDAWLASTAVAPPHGESFDATATRVRAALHRVLRSHAGQRVVCVSHVTPVKTLLRIALEAPPSALYRMHLDLVSLSEVQWFADGPAVVRSMNDTGHLRG
ncbi:MAG TPA: bifunctional RNase H/acid phosphatase [Mycobacteriales bacterium]|nr:bifunctional RNase H/acid phosphatase [Mycobacteriales bacterium]